MAAKRRAPPAPDSSRTPSPAARTVWTWIAPLAVGLAALLAYANSLRNGFVWDDPIILTRQLVVFRTVGDVLAPPRDIPQFSPDYYRPVTIASYLLDRAVGGDDPFAYHLSVVLAHALSAALLCLLARQLLHRGAAAAVGALTAGLLFALHPIHSESVAWAAGRSDVLATGFLLAVLVVHGRLAWTWRGGIASGLCAAGALGAKETGIALYPLMLLRDLVCPDATSVGAAVPGRAVAAATRPGRGEWLRAYAGVAIVGAVYVLLRRHALGEFVGSAPEAVLVQRSLRDLVAALGTYVLKLLWPLPLNAYIDHIDGGPLPIAAAAAFGAALIAAAWCWRARAGGVPLYALLWIGLTLVPSLAILWKIPDAPLAERYLYLPSVGVCLLAGDLVERAWRAVPLRRLRSAVAVAVAIVALAAAVATVRRNPVWHDDVALWEDTEAKSQVSGMAARSLGTAYQQAGRAVDARAAFERALERHNSPRGLQTIRNNLGTLAMYERDYAAAQRHYEAALAANPTAADSLFNLGLAIAQGGGSTPESARRALPYFLRAREINPHDPDIEAGLGQMYAIIGNQPAARAHLQRALELEPDARMVDSVRQLLTRLDAESTAH